MSVLVEVTNPFRPQIGMKHTQIPGGLRVSTILRQHGLISGRGAKIVRNGPYVVLVNGLPTLQRHWGKRLREKDHIVISRLAQGGGGGSNPLQIVAMVAVLAASLYTGGAAGVAYFGTATAAHIAGAAIMIIGSQLVSMMFPPKPLDTSSAASNAAAQTSPTYSFDVSGTNSPRLLQAIPVLYGRFRCVPDLASQPYVENNGNDQYLHQLLCVTQGDISIESINIDDTNIYSYDGVQIEVVPPGGTVTLFPSDVVTSAGVNGLTLYGPNNPSFSVPGPFATNPPGTTINQIGIDIAFPSGIYSVDDDGNKQASSLEYEFDARSIDDAGNPLNDWSSIVHNISTYGNEQSQQVTFTVAVPTGRYEVRGQRINAEPNDGRSMGTAVWTGLRGYIPAAQSFGNVTMIAIIIKASNSINGSIANKINVVATRLLPTWDPVEGWGPAVATRNPAWAIADALRNTEYGRGMVDTQYNLPELYRLAAVWASRGDEFDGVFDTTETFWSCLQELCAVGRAMPIYYAGQVDIIRNEPKTLPTAVFGPQNMVTGSFSARYLFPEVDSPDHVIMEYTDPTTWQTEQVPCILPGSPGLNPSTVTMKGMANRTQAWREGITLAAKNRDQRRSVTFTTGEEGLLPRYNDLVAVAHDAVGWGYTGRIESFDSDTGIIVSTEPFVYTLSQINYIGFRKKDGSMDGPYVIEPASNGDPNSGYIDASGIARALIYISNGISEDYTQYMMGVADRQYLQGVMQSVAPGNDNSVAITLVNYASSVHIAENGGDVPPPGPVSNLPQTPVVPIINSVSLQLTATIGTQIIVATPARGATYYQFQAKIDGGDWADLGISVTPQMQVQLSTGTWSVRVRGVGKLAGPWTTWTGFVDASAFPVPIIASLLATTDEVFEIDIAWAIGPDTGIAASVEIWEGLTDVLADAQLLINMPLPATKYVRKIDTPDAERYYFARVVDTSGRRGAFFGGGVGVFGQTSQNTAKIMAYFDGQINQTHLSNELLTYLATHADLDPVYAYVDSQDTILTNELTAQASRITDVAASIDPAITAQVETVQEAVTDLSGNINASYQIKVQASSDGRQVLAGIGVGIDNTSGTLTSEVLVFADRFAVGASTDIGTFRSAFIVADGIVYMNTAFIQDATITTAKIADANITTAKIADANITGAKIGYATITEANIADANITRAKIGSLAVDTLRIGDNSVVVGAGVSYAQEFGASSGSNSVTAAIQTNYNAMMMISYSLRCEDTSSTGPEYSAYMGGNLWSDTIATCGFTPDDQYIPIQVSGSYTTDVVAPGIWYATIAVDRPGGTRRMYGRITVLAIQK